MSKSLENALSALHDVDGFIAASFVESETGITLNSTVGAERFDIEIAGAINANVVQAKRRALAALKLDEDIEDIAVTLGGHYHLMRIVPGRPDLFAYLALDRAAANMAMARLALVDATDSLVFEDTDKLMVEVIDELVGSGIDGIGPPERLQRADPGYPRGVLNRSPKPPVHHKKPGDSPSCAFPRRVIKRN